MRAEESVWGDLGCGFQIRRELFRNLEKSSGCETACVFAEAEDTPKVADEGRGVIVDGEFEEDVVYLHDDGERGGYTSRCIRFEEGIKSRAPFGGLCKNSVMVEFLNEMLRIEDERCCRRRKIVEVIDTIIESHLWAGFGECGGEVSAVEEVGEVL